MIRRVAICTLGFLAVLGVLAGPASACEREHTGADWACLYVEHIDMGVCQQNPLPQDLPTDVPDELQVVPDDAPEIAPIVESVVPLIPDVKPEVPSTASVLATVQSLVPGGDPVPSDPVPSDPTSLVPEPPLPPYEPTGMPGTPI